MSRTETLKLSENTLIPAGIAFLLVGGSWYVSNAYTELRARDVAIEARQSIVEQQNAARDSKLDRIIEDLSQAKGDLREIKGALGVRNAQASAEPGRAP